MSKLREDEAPMLSQWIIRQVDHDSCLVRMLISKLHTVAIRDAQHRPIAWMLEYANQSLAGRCLLRLLF